MDFVDDLVALVIRIGNFYMLLVYVYLNVWFSGCYKIALITQLMNFFVDYFGM